MPARPFLIAIMGPTASGKTAVAEYVADELGLALLSADAFMVYKGLDVGTNKPARKSEDGLIDLVGPEEEFGVGEYVVRASTALNDLWERNRGAVIVGGTGFYVRALLEQYDDLLPPPDPSLRAELMEIQELRGLPALVDMLLEQAPKIAAGIDLMNPVRVRRALERVRDPRPPIQFDVPPFFRHKFVLDPSGIDEEIASRTTSLLDSGWIEETNRLLEQNVKEDAPAFRAIGYDSTIGFVKGALTRQETEQKINVETRQYAKRQRTWLRGEPRVSRRFEGDVGVEFSRACAREIIDVCHCLGKEDG